MFMNVIIEPFIVFSNNPVIIIWLWLMIFYTKNYQPLSACFLLMSAVIVNVWLKDIWHIPLPYESTTFAFPSGHMHASTVVYGYIASCSKSSIEKSLLFAIILGIGLAEIKLGYHNIFDILGGFFFAILHIFTYKYAASIYSERNVNTYLLIFTSVIAYMYMEQAPYVLLCWSLMLAHLIGRFIIPKNETEYDFVNNIGFICSLCISLFLYLIYNTYISHLLHTLIHAIYYTLSMLLVVYLPIWITSYGRLNGKKYVY